MFSVSGTRNVQYENFGEFEVMLSVQKPPPRPAQYEALAVWDLMAIKQRQQRFERRMRKAEKTLAEARWDNESKMWRRGIVDGLKLFPAIAQGDETQGKKATFKTDKDSNKPKETKRSWIEEDDSDDDDFLNQLLHDRPSPYAVDDNVPSTSAGPGNQTQDKGVTDTVQTSDTVLTQSSASVPTAPDMQIQLQPPPQTQRIYPDVPVIETTTSLIVPSDTQKSRLVQLEPTPQLLPQQQLVPSYSPVAGSPLVPAPATVSQALGVPAQRGLGPGKTLAAISLPVTVGPPVPLYAQDKLREKPIEWYQQTDRFVKLAKCLWEDLNTLFEIIVPPDLWLECKRGVDWPKQEPARDKVTGAPSEEVMKYYHKVIEFLKQKVSPKVTDWQKIDRTSQEVKESIHAYYERFCKAFKHYSGTKNIEPKDMNHLVFRFVEGLRPEVSQMIKNHLICWQVKPIDEVLQYAKYCSDEMELMQRKLKEKVMVMQIKAAQAGMQGNGIQQMIQQQPQGNGVFQAQPRG
ncbi:hypothetical protein NDU88_002733 [Pleurodeles waltl]|uniref:Uncharacterized protein n=1 Tax=Pleurodeles waltl TaxID=8319 RepID=A0AAV7UWF7_PLEWA|nr:hypothetical protein NDU88_002733 [Pleurodeles waltl]